MGYKKKGSRDSLIASSILAGLLVLSAGLMSLAGNSYGVRLAAGTMCTPTSCWCAQSCSCYNAVCLCGTVLLAAGERQQHMLHCPGVTSAWPAMLPIHWCPFAAVQRQMPTQQDEHCCQQIEELPAAVQ